MFTMHWASPASQLSSRRRPQYVSPSTESVSISVNGGPLQITDKPSGSAISTITIDAPLGTDSFAIVAYDSSGATGSALSKTTVSQQVVAGQANTLSATLDGVVASIAVTLSNASPAAGQAATVQVNVAAQDADGNVIVGPGNYDRVVQVTDGDTFATSIASGTANITVPGQSATLNYNGNSIWSATISASAPGIASSAVTSVVFAPQPTFYAYPLTITSDLPYYIAAGSDGALWFTDETNYVGRITTGGTLTEYATPTSGSAPEGITSGPNGALWFTEYAANKIGTIETNGTVSAEYSIPATDGGFPDAIAAGPDGALWFVGQSGNKVGRMTTTGTFSSYTIPTASSDPYDITSGPDGALWFSENRGNIIGRITTGGAISEYSIPTASSFANGITSGPDGALWFTETNANKIGRITTAGTISEYLVTTPSSYPWGIAPGPDGALWFTETLGNKIGRITTGGMISEYVIPGTNPNPDGIVAGSDGALWFAEQNVGKIGRFAY